jgi:hypothetical protein
MDEQDQCWTAVTIRYICPACHKPDQQVFVFEGGTYGNEPLHKATARMTPCTKCNAPIPKNLPLETDTVVATLEQLRKAGYPTPPVN